MGLKLKWYSHQGPRTNDNRDYCGIGVRKGATLCIVLDGSTTTQQSGALVQLIAHELVDWFVKAEEAATSALVEEQLSFIHKQCRMAFPSDSASYAILLVESCTSAVSLHAGDCLIGKLQQPDLVTWLTQPHTLANATDDLSVTEIAATPLRNRLTRSFRAGPFLRPEINSFKIDRTIDLIVATDGFWADLAPDKQLRYLSDSEISRDLLNDDCSALIMRFHDQADGVRIGNDMLHNLYIGIASEMV